MNTLSWLWLAAGLGYGATNAGELLELCGGSVTQLQQVLDSAEVRAVLTRTQYNRLQSSHPQQFAPMVERAAAEKLTLLTFENKAYPAMLRHIVSPPPVLYAKGDTTLLNNCLLIGMVGTRRPSSYGTEVVKTIGEQLACSGAVVVSGLAAGLDSEAHKAALRQKAPTIACIAFGHAHCYPAANRKLMQTIAANGLVLGEYPPDVSAEKAYFLQRNRLIAGISNGLVVTEARRFSGTISTVNFAAEFGRDVFAVPGSIYSELSGGTNLLIQEGAYLATSGEDILKAYGMQASTPQPQDFVQPPRRLTQAAPMWHFEQWHEPPPFTQQLSLENNPKLAVHAPPAAPSLPPTAGVQAENRQSVTAQLSPPAQVVQSMLGPQPLGLEDLCEACGLPFQQVLAALTELEMAALCEQLAGRRFKAKY